MFFYQINGQRDLSNQISWSQPCNTLVKNHIPHGDTLILQVWVIKAMVLFPCRQQEREKKTQMTTKSREGCCILRVEWAWTVWKFNFQVDKVFFSQLNFLPQWKKKVSYIYTDCKICITFITKVCKDCRKHVCFSKLYLSNYGMFIHSFRLDWELVGNRM